MKKYYFTLVSIWFVCVLIDRYVVPLSLPLDEIALIVSILILLYYIFFIEKR